MSKVTDVGVVERNDAACLAEVSDELRVALTDIAATAREGLLAMSVAVGLQVMAELMDDEITATGGPKHARLTDRTPTRHASRSGRWCWAGAGWRSAGTRAHPGWSGGAAPVVCGVRGR